MTQLRELLDLPERIHKSQFVMTLQRGVGDPATVVEHYAVTQQIHDAYDQALGFVKVAIDEHQNVASYLHGSFGSGKSHFMAMLSLMLGGERAVWQNEALHDLRARHEWLTQRKVLRLHFNMIDAPTVEDVIFRGYLAHLAEEAPEAPLPAVFKDAALFDNAEKLRASLGDERFFADLNQGRPAGKAGWGKLKTAQAWDAARFEDTVQSGDPAQRALLLTDLTRTHFPAFADGSQGFVGFEQGLGEICAHAKQHLGADCLVLFLDELVLWLGSIAADKPRLNREVPKLSRLVERDIAGNQVPVVTFAARQRDIAEMVGEEFIGPEHEHLRNALTYWEGRFNTIRLGDKNLPEIVEKRVVRPKNADAKKQLEGAFDKLRGQLRGSAYSTLLGEEGDERAFRRVYPFSPALIETLIALSHLLQRERTAIKVLMELLVEHLPAHMPEFQLGEVIPVGELWDVLAAGEEPMDGNMRQLFRQAKKLYELDLLPVLQSQASDNPRADQRLIKTLLLATLVPQVPSLKNLTVSRLVQLNHGSLRTLIPGGEVQKASAQLREWAAAIHNLRIEEGEDPRVTLVLDEVEVTPIIEAAQSYNTDGARKGKLRRILFDALGLQEGHDSFDHKVVWRGSRRTGAVLYGNVREMDDVQLQASQDHDFKLVIDYPFDKPGHAPTEDAARLSQFTESGLSSPTIVWLPSFFGDKVQRALGDLVIIDRILEGGNYKRHMDHLREDDQRRARTALEHLSNQKRAQVRKALAVAYGLRAASDASEGDIDEARSIERHFFSLFPDCPMRTPAKSEFSRAVEAAVGELMESRYPRHPRFDPADRAVTVGMLDKAFDAYARVCATPEQRLPVSKRELGEYAIAEILQMLELSEAHATVRPRFAQEITKRLNAEGITTPTVREVKRALDPENVRGLADDVADFEVRCFALVTHRELYREGKPVTEMKFGRLGPDWELVQAELPSMTQWEEAVKRAGTLFGITLSRALNVNNLRLFSERLNKAVERATRDRAQDVAGVLRRRAQDYEAEGARLQTAEAVASLLRALAPTDPVAQVEAIAESEPHTSLTAMQKHLVSAATTLAKLQDDLLFGTFEALKSRSDAAATQLLAEVREVLLADQVTVALVPELQRLGLAAQKLIAGSMPPPSGRVQVGSGNHAHVGAEEAMSVLGEATDAIRAALDEAGETGELTLSWKVTKEGD